MTKIEITDCYGIHSGFILNLGPGYTALVGPNGAGKTTLLRQIAEHAESTGAEVIHYNNLNHGGKHATDKYLMEGKIETLVAAATSSEGEAIAFNFGQIVKQIGEAVSRSAESGSPVYILLDGLDSGASIDRLRELRKFFRMIEQDAQTGIPVYLVVAVNNYELVRDARCINVRNGQEKRFTCYGNYADFICYFFKDFPGVKSEAKPVRRKRRGAQG